MKRRASGDVRTTAALRRAIQQSSASIRSLARRYAINPKTVAKWRQRNSVGDLRSGPKRARSSVLRPQEEAIALAARQYLGMSLDECLGVLKRLFPHLTRSSLHRCWQRHGVSGPTPTLQFMTGSEGAQSRFGAYTVRIVEISSSEPRMQLLVAVQPTSKWLSMDIRCQSNKHSIAEAISTLFRTAPQSIETLIAHGVSAEAIDTVNEVCTANGASLRLDALEPWSVEQLRTFDGRVSAAITAALDEHGVETVAAAISKTVAAYNRERSREAVIQRSARERIPVPARHLSGQRARTTKLRDDDHYALWRRTQPARGATKPTRAQTSRRQPRDTREAILEAARSCLAHDGPEGLSLAEVARLAGVNRGTAYKHFKTREKLIAASADWVSDKLYRAVFGEPQDVSERPVGETDIAQLTDRLANFAIENPELCRAWLLKVLSSPNPWSDPFWREYQGRAERFADSEFAMEGIDPEALSVIMLAGAFLWPVWARPKAKQKADLRALAHRYSQECLRISMYGNLRSERYPEVAARLQGYQRRRNTRAKPAQ